VKSILVLPERVCGWNARAFRPLLLKAGSTEYFAAETQQAQGSMERTLNGEPVVTSLPD